MRELVGDGHRDLVGSLHAAWLGLRRPRMITLTGFPGAGKSRLVQELYQRIASDQSAPPYWPAEIPVSGDELTARRKRLAPGSFTVPSGAEAEFVWLAIEGRVEQDTGLPMFALGGTAFAQQMHDHVVGLLAAAESSSGASRQAARDLGEALVQLGAFIPLLAPLATAIGMSDSFGALRRAAQSLAAVRSRHAPDREVGTVDSQSVLREAVGAFSRLSEILPIVLAVEDAHDLDETSVRFIHDLLESSRGRVLVVATAWPDRIGPSSRRDTFGWLASLTSWPAIEQWTVPALMAHDLAGFVVSEAPGTSPTVVDALVNRSGGNPLLLEGLLRVRLVARSYDPTSQAFDLSAQDLDAAELPRSVAGLYQRMWDELPEAVQDVLMVASVEGTVFTPDWSIELVEEWLGRSGAAESHVEARDTYSWVRALDGRIDQFVELSLVNAAAQGAISALTQRERAGLRSAIVQRALAERGSEQWVARPQESRVSLLRHIVNACDEGLLDDVDEFAWRFELAKFEAERFRWRSAIQVLGDHVPDGESPEIFEARNLVASWLVEVGREAEAVRLLEHLLEDQSRVLGNAHEDTLATRHRLAWSTRRSETTDRLVEIFEVLIADAVRALGARHPLVMTVRHAAAVALADRGRALEALTQFEELLTSRTVSSLDVGVDEFVIRHNIASCLSDLGRKREALAQFEQVLDERSRRSGEGHPSTFSTRGFIAGLLSELGYLEQSLEHFEALMLDHVRTYGDDALVTLRQKARCVGVLRDLGRYEEAESMLRGVLDRKAELFGADHRETFSSRRELAQWCAEGGRIGEAIELFEALITDQDRVLGAGDPETLTTRGWLARWCGEAGGLREAIELCEALIPDQVRVLGAGHPHTLSTRGWLARWCGEAGRVGEAIELFEALIADQVRVLGIDHPFTSESRVALARWCGEAGRVGEAIELFEALIADQVRVLGTDHPVTLTTRMQLARWCGEVGRVDEAIELFEVLLEDQVRVLGTDHPHTLTTRGWLARWCGEAGRVGEAIELGEALLVDQSRVLGPEHPETLATRSNQAHFLREVGRIDEALELFESVFRAEERVLGPDHPDTMLRRGNLARSLREVGRVDEALSMLEVVLNYQYGVLGVDHPAVMETRGNVAFLHIELGDHGVAASMLESLLDDQIRTLGADHESVADTRRWLDIARNGFAPE